ncbi:MAG TPA: hypothetical protein VJX66_31980 [Amycolatopsis sp.]|nr:hypothetical protein [Amycolatopsis sp.]
MASSHTAEQRAAALALLRDGVGVRETERQTGIPRSTLSQWATEAGIVNPRATQTANAVAATRLAWTQRRGALVDKVGESAEALLERLVGEADAADVKHLSVAFGVLVDKAQLLSGAATSRHEVLDAQRRRNRVEEMADELAARRAAKDGTTGS